jgi:hypothetical protein
MTIEKKYIMPVILLALNLGCAIFCFCGGDWKRGVYWIASAVCIAAMTF